MRNQKGVTLIALVVTIIVLIIIAGISIAALLGDNGVITRSKQAKQSQIEGEVRDKVTLAVAAAKMYAEQKSVENSGYSASATGTPNTLATDTVNQVAGDLNGWTDSTQTTAKNTSGTTDYFVETYANGLHIIYAKIECWVKVDGNTFTFDTTKGEGATSAWKYTRAA